MKLVPTYESRLASSLDNALKEASRHFECRSAVFETLASLVKALDELRISYAVTGCLAMFAHGYRRSTQNVDVLVTSDGLQRFDADALRLGFVSDIDSESPHPFRDSRTGVRIDFIIARQRPRGLKPAVLPNPDPVTVAETINGVRYLTLESLIEMKLNFGMAAGVSRLKSIADAIELVKELKLPRAFAEQLSPLVADKFGELWQGIADSPIPPWQEIEPECRKC